jgi:hypothetical protein
MPRQSPIDTPGELHYIIAMGPFIEYAHRAEFWIKHSFELLAVWTRETFCPEAWLCLFRSKGASWASFIKGMDVKEVEKRPELLMKEPVLVSGNMVE